MASASTATASPYLPTPCGANPVEPGWPHPSCAAPPLEAATAEAAVQRIQALPAGPAVGNFLIADTHHARNLEILTEGVQVTEHRRRRLRPRQQLHRPQSYSRTKPSAARSPIPRAAAISLQSRARSHHAGSIDTDVCRTPPQRRNRPTGACPAAAFRSGDPFSTIAALIAVPHTQTLHLSHGPPTSNHFTAYRL